MAYYLGEAKKYPYLNLRVIENISSDRCKKNGQHDFIFCPWKSGHCSILRVKSANACAYSVEGLDFP